MDVKVLGCYGRFAPVGGATSGYLISTNSGKNIVIDLGSGCLSALQKYIKIEDIDLIIASHLHFDHISDIGVLKYAMGFLKIKTIKLYMPSTPNDMHNILSGGFDTAIIDENLVIEDFGVKIEFFKNHHPVETYAVKITEGEKVLVYTSDCMICEDVLNSTAGANAVIGDACILDRDHTQNAAHLSVKSLCESVPKDCNLYLSHLTLKLEKDIQKEANCYHNNARLIEDFTI